MEQPIDRKICSNKIIYFSLCDSGAEVNKRFVTMRIRFNFSLKSDECHPVFHRLRSNMMLSLNHNVVPIWVIREMKDADSDFNRG